MRWTIENCVSGESLGEWEGATAAEAYHAMLRDAGYHDAVRVVGIRDGRIVYDSRVMPVCDDIDAVVDYVLDIGSYRTRVRRAPFDLIAIPDDILVQEVK